MSELPAHWCWVTVGDLGSVTGGLTQNSKREALSSKMPFLRVANVYANELRLDQVSNIGVTENEVARVLLKEGDLLVVEGNGSIDQLGRVAVWNGAIEHCVHQNHLIKVRFITVQISQFAMYWFLSTAGRDQIVRVASSTSGLHTLSISKIQALRMPLAPLSEQVHIIEAIESYCTRLDDAVATLERVERNLKRYRASVLKSAVEGRLVPTEAELAKQEKRDYEPASVLLERILAERRRRWSESGKKGKYQEPTPPDTSNLPQLPEGWCWASVDQLTAFESHALCDGPFGSNLKSSHYKDSGPRVVRLQNIGEGFFRDVKTCISEEHFQSLKKHSVYAGDLVIASLGEILPRAALIPEWLGPAIVKADCIRFAANRELASNEYLMHALNSVPVRKRTEELVHGVGRPRIGLGLLRQIAIPLPPRIEQERIDYEIDSALLVCKFGKHEAIRAISRCEQLRQSILKSAFEGRLADQDLNSETADALLERLKSRLSDSEPTSRKIAAADPLGRSGRVKPLAGKTPDKEIFGIVQSSAMHSRGANR